MMKSQRDKKKKMGPAKEKMREYLNKIQYSNELKYHKFYIIK
jgi:hypothetical protein